MGLKNKINFSELNDRVAMASIHYVDDGYGGLKRDFSEEKSFWAAVTFVSARDVISKSIKGIDAQKGALRKSIYQLVVRQETEVISESQLSWKGRVLKPLNAMVPCDKRQGYSHFYAVEIKGET